MKLTLLTNAGLSFVLLCCSHWVMATIVQVKTNVGDFEINLYDQSTPVTVQNFLTYVNSGKYNGTVIHRSVPGFVVQGGGFVFEQQLPLKAVATNAAIVNEPKWSNVRATIAMAKLEKNINSATNQWFINLVDNSAGLPMLDTQNGGFTVFGQINAQGMEIIDSIAGFPRYTFPGIENLPLRNYTANDRDDNKPLSADNFITVESIVVVDARVDSAAALTKVPNTLLTVTDPDPAAVSSGAFNILSLLAVMLISGLRIWRTRNVAN